jgi:hypothetical protein
MAILDKLQTTGSPYSKNNGATPKISDFKASLVHNTYSINGDPKLVGYPKPSLLDLDGKTPAKYSDQKFE